MDYSSISHDPSHPAEPSPWDSPRASRDGFGGATSTSDFPTLSTHPQSPYHENEDSNRSGSPTRGAAGEDMPSSPDLSERLQSAQLGDPDYAEHPPHATQPGDGYAQQGRPHAPARYQTGARQNAIARPAAPIYRLHGKITGLERSGKKDPILRFDVYVGGRVKPFNSAIRLTLSTTQKTNIPKFRTTQYRDVRRTHSEFVKLAEYLISSTPEALVPAVPPPLTPAGAGTEEDEIRVKASMQRWMNYVFGNEVLILDDEITLFVESDFGYSPVVKMKQPATGVRRKVIKQFAPPPDDTPELQNARPVVKMFYLGAMDTSQKVDRVVRARRGRIFIRSML